MTRRQIDFAFLNVGHFLDHLFMLIFASVAALTLASRWELSYAELIPYATPGFVAFGLCALPAGWLADKWSREGMMAVFFAGIGLAAIATSFADSPFQIGVGLFAIGVFAAIYHPVGIAMVVQGRTRTGVALAINGVFGNMGVASAALLTGLMIDTADWSMAFMIPGVVSVVIGIAYVIFLSSAPTAHRAQMAASKKAAAPLNLERADLLRIFAVIFFTTAVGGLIFQSTTFALPKVFDERLGDLASSATQVGWYAFLVFAVAAFAQLAVGYLVDNHSARSVFAFVALMQAVFFALMVSLEGILALVVAIGFMLVVFGQIPINDVLVGRITHSAWRSRVFACRYIVTFSVMASAVPLIAWIHASWGFSALFVVMAISASLIFAAVMMMPARGAVVHPVPA